MFMITIDKSSAVTLQRQLLDACRKEIATGAIPAGSKLPALRKLADELGISRNTVEAAYRQLVQEGYVRSKPGSGYVVEELDIDEMLAAWGKDLHEHAESGTQGDTTGAADGLEPLCAPYPIRYDFAYGDLAEGSFPSDIWRRLTTEALFGENAQAADTYGPEQGDACLREAIARRLVSALGAPCRAERIVVQPGTQASLAKLLGLFDAASDAVAFENPGFYGARIVFERLGFETVALPVDEQGNWDIASLEKSRPRLIFVTPSSQFPTGKTMPLSTRQQLIRWATRNDAYIIEDGYCHEFRYNAMPLPALLSIDASGRVVHMGTFSKVLSPAIRMSYLVLPPKLLAAWRTRYEGFRNEVPWITQAAMSLLIEQGHWDRLVKRAQTRNKRKHAALVGALEKHGSNRVEVMHGNAGLHLLVRTRDDRGQEALVEAAAQEGVRVYGTRRSWMTQEAPWSDAVLIGFSRITEDDIEAGVRALMRAWFEKPASQERQGGNDAPAPCAPIARFNRARGATAYPAGLLF